MNNVIDAIHRFPSSHDGKDKPKPTPLDKLRASSRTERTDALLLAERLGEIAYKLSPERPQSIAKQWFDKLWNGDRWTKRKRYILFRNETAPDPIASNGADWAALVEQAARSLYPDNSVTSDKERARVSRDVLRGTSFLPATNFAPLRSDNAQLLMVALTAGICGDITAKTEIVQLWEALEQTPFKIESYPKQPIYSNEDIKNAEFCVHERYDGDAYSCGPLGEAARGADNVSRYRYVQWENRRYRFEPINTYLNTYPSIDWPFPRIRLGIVGYRWNSRIFVIPHGFIGDLPFDQKFEDGEKFVFERVPEWLAMKGIISEQTQFDLPEIQYSEEQGFGWHPCSFDIPKLVWLEVRPRADGSPGLWLSSFEVAWDHCFPIIKNMDTLAIEAGRTSPSFLNFSRMILDPTFYEFLEWPTDMPEFLIGSDLPVGAFSGIIDPDVPDVPTIEGWLDDLENVEIQEFLFHLPPDARFCSSITLDDAPPPCRAGTIAAAIFANVGSAPDERIAMRLRTQADIISTNGLGVHAALLAWHRTRIETMIPE